MATTVTLDGGLLTVLTGVVLPLLVSLVSKRVTKSSVQAYLLLGLSILGGALTSIIASGGTFDLKEVLINIAVCFATGQTSYSRIWKPAGVTGKLQDVGGIITAADPEKVKALEGQPAEAEPAGDVLEDAQVVAVDGETGADPVEPAEGLVQAERGTDDRVAELEGHLASLQEENARLQAQVQQLMAELDAAQNELAAAKPTPTVTKKAAPKTATKKSPASKGPPPA